MKKYWGKREWSETLYLSEVFEPDAFDKDGNLDESKAWNEYYIGMKFDWHKIMGFNDTNTFEDTNDFITYSETFNVYQAGKI